MSEGKDKDDVHGEGNYKATRDYNKGLKDHVEHHDIEREARDAEPRSEEEAREMDEAEKVARERAKGTGDSQAAGGMGNNPA